MAYDEWPRCSWTTFVWVLAASRKLAAGVPKGVQGDAAEAGLLREELKAAQHVAGLERCPDLGGEDQPVLLPDPGGRALFRQLPSPVSPERLDGRAREWHGPAGPVGG